MNIDRKRARIVAGRRGSRCVVGLTALVCFVACDKHEAVAKREAIEAPHVDEPAHEEMPRIVSLRDEVVVSAGIQTAAAAREVLAVTLALPGEVAADPDRSARLSSPIPGVIEQVHFQEGSLVDKGAVLATLRVPDLGKLRSTQAASRAQALAARANVTRLKQLLDQRLAAEQTYLDALATAEALETQARAASEQVGALGLDRAQKNPSSLALRAPIAGVVVRRNAIVGQPIAANEVLCEIVDLSEVWFLGRVFEKDLGRLSLGAAAEVQLNAYPKQRFSGEVEYIGRQVDPIARTVTARIRLQNRADLLRLGLFGTGYVSSNDVASDALVLVVPRSALTEVAGQQVVFVRHADGDFELHEVVLGASAAGKVQILQGLREGEQVVSEGVFTLKSAVLKSTFAEDE